MEGYSINKYLTKLVRIIYWKYFTWVPNYKPFRIHRIMDL